LGSESDGGGGADGSARKAVVTLRPLPLCVGERIGLSLALARAQIAFDALVLIDAEFEQVPAGEQSQEGSEGAEIAAPEPLPCHVEQEEAQEQDSDEEALQEYAVQTQDLEILDEPVSQR